MTFIQYSIILLITSLYIYVLIDRICRCIEHCSSARAFAKSIHDLDDLEKLEHKGVDLRELSENHTN